MKVSQIRIGALFCFGALILAALLISSACGGKEIAGPDITPTAEPLKSEHAQAAPQPTQGEEKMKTLSMKINDTAVSVDWENNESVAALTALCADEPLVINMSMYGGFEQVGPIGARLPSNDVQTKTDAGDIVLYSGNQIVVFYGANTWAYTRLGHITDKSAAELRKLLGSENAVITITTEG